MSEHREPTQVTRTRYPEHAPSDEEWGRMSINERLQAAADMLNHFKGVPRLPKDEAEEAAEAARRLAQRIDAHDRNQRKP